MSSTFEQLLEGLSLNGLVFPLNEVDNDDSTKDFNNNDIKNNSNNEAKLFTLSNFINDLTKSSAAKNKEFIDNSNRLNAYDIAHSCVRTGFFRVLNYPVKKYSNNWLPIVLRGLMGTAAHEFLQEISTDFTETEVYLRIPSRQISVKIDCLINQDTLVEIKTCPYTEYEKILKTKSARPGDFKQALLYKHLLETYVSESKLQELPKDKYSLPKYDNYDIKTIQMIYLCNDLFTSDLSLDDAVKNAKDLRKKLQSKFNHMWFIQTINYDLNKCDITSHINILKEKLDMLNIFLNTNTVPPMSNKFIDKKSCFFCLYKDSCAKHP